MKPRIHAVSSSLLISSLILFGKDLQYFLLVQECSISNQSITIPRLHKHFLAKRSKMRYNDINKGAFELDKE